MVIVTLSYLKGGYGNRPKSVLLSISSTSIFGCPLDYFRLPLNLPFMIIL